VLYFAFLGTESALATGSEIVAPASTVPRAIMLAVGVIALLYLAIQLAVQSVLGAGLAGAPAPLVSAAGVIYGPWGRLAVASGASIGMAALVAGDLIASPRIVFALGRDGVLPRVVGAVHATRHTPHVAIIAYGVLCCALALSGTFRALAFVAGAGTLLLYAMTCLAVLVLRRRGVTTGVPPFVVPGGPVVPLLAVVLIGYVLTALTRNELLSVLAVLAVGSALHGWSRWHAAKRG
jgi:amino acid transporter